MDVIYGFPLDKEYDLERLSHEMKAQSIPDTEQAPIAFGGDLLLYFRRELTDEEKTLLESILLAHDGTIPSRTSNELQVKREALFSELVDLAHNHPVLKIDSEVNQTGEDVISDYLRSLDNWVNAWRRDGNHKVLYAKIQSDAATGQPFETFLNTPVDLSGNVTWQFLISYIPTTPYI